MESTHSTDPPAGKIQAEDRVQGTVIEFGSFQVRQSRRGNQTILKFVGAATSTLGHDLDLLISRCRGDVGIDFSDLEGLSPALVHILERLRKRLHLVRRSLFLCNPPSKLIDALTLGGFAHAYPIAGVTPDSGISEVHLPKKETPSLARPQRGSEEAAREIAHFDHSLKRTERLEKDLESAAHCVQKILPSREPVLSGYKFAFTYRQSEIVGGDFFDFIPLGGRELGISIGDVSGKGLEAAILMCLAKKLIALRASCPSSCPRPQNGAKGHLISPREVLSRVNEDLRNDLDRTTFVTAMFAVLNAQEGVLRFARAGHERPIYFLPGSGAEPQILASEGAALGILGPEPFRSRIQEHFVEIRPGEGVFFFTDGLVDARNLRGQTYSRPRIADTLRRTRRGQLPGEILSNLFEEIARYSGGSPPCDDMTAVLIMRDS